jgi:hypothetical protein
MVRCEKEAEGYDREAYEYEIQLGGRMASKSSRKEGQEPRSSTSQAHSTFLVILEGSLDTPEKIQEAAGLSTTPRVMKGTGDTGEASFCRVDGNAKQAIIDWLSREHVNFNPTFVRLSKAEKDLSSNSIHPTLGLDATLPQHRPHSNDTTFSPAHNQYPVWYFFYGTLADTGVLSGLLSLPEAERPVLRPASITGGITKTWADKYKALVDGPATARTDGWAYQVVSKEHEEALLFYETEKYEVVRCTISMNGEEEEVVKGCTFRFVESLQGFS